MRIVIAGGHGQIALLLAARLAAGGHHPVGLIRNPEHSAEVREAGGEPLVIDLEAVTAAELAAHLEGVDAVVFAAGAGPGSTAARKLTLDRDGAILLLAAARLAQVRRYVMVSAIGADAFDPASDDVFQIYLRAKSEADAALRDSDLDWTIVRPGGLTNNPGTGQITAAASTGRGSIPRADVAAVLAWCLLNSAGVGRQFELIGGTTPIPEAVASLKE